MEKNEVERWNEANPSGTGVIVKLDNGSLWHTKTRSQAWVTDAGHPVVMLEGKAGSYLLSRVRPMERQDTVLA